MATGTIGARFVVVDTLNTIAASFYEHHGFRPIPATRRLIAKLSDIAAALSE